MRPVSLIIGFVLVTPMPALAQAPKPADLVGKWTQQGEKGIVFTFRPDSTFTWKVGTGKDFYGDAPMNLTGRWRLAGDSLLVSDLAVNLRGVALPPREAAVKDVQRHMGDLNQRVKLDGQVLTMSELTGKRQRTYERLKPEFIEK